jgi:hypothetical protein
MKSEPKLLPEEGWHRAAMTGLSMPEASWILAGGESPRFLRSKQFKIATSFSSWSKKANKCFLALAQIYLAKALLLFSKRGFASLASPHRMWWHDTLPIPLIPLIPVNFLQ